MSFAKSGRRGNMRKKEKEDSDQEGGVESAVVRKEKSSVKSALSATTAGQKRKMDSFYESSKTVMPSIGKDLSATAPAEEELDEPQGKGAAVRGESEGGLYKGEANRQKLIQKREVMDKKSNSIGPIKAPTNVRMTCRFDYQPDLCKDWKETGYCGFGDSCKFMHDRGDYKAGWELERDWAVQEERKKMEAAVREMEGEKGEEVDDGLPFACAICRGPFDDPVETKCMHYFNYTQTRRCFICNEQTHGQFNTATKLQAKLDRFGKGAKSRKTEDGDQDKADEDGFAEYRAVEQSRNAEGGWQIPGNTFAEGKKF